jgi:cytochrome c556
MNRLVPAGMAMVCFLAGSVLAQDAAPATPEEQAQKAVETRQGLFKLMGWSFAPVAGMLRNKVPFDAAAVQKSGERLENLSLMIPDLFQPDTHPYKAKTGALEGIWTSKTEFNGKAAEMNKAATALVAAAKTGDKSATLKAAGALGKACGSCHDTFRQK